MDPQFEFAVLAPDGHQIASPLDTALETGAVVARGDGFRRFGPKGDVLEETSHLADLKLRENPRGKMLFVTNEAVYKNKASGQVVAKQRLTSIHM